jgi:hypothetical protein
MVYIVMAVIRVRQDRDICMRYGSSLDKFVNGADWRVRHGCQVMFTSTMLLVVEMVN